jgi:hypothetical protein
MSTSTGEPASDTVKACAPPRGVRPAVSRRKADQSGTATATSTSLVARGGNLSNQAMDRTLRAVAPTSR